MAADRFATFARDLQLATADLAPDAIARDLAKFAREELARAIAAGEASSSYTRYVNGRVGVAEESVVAPGPIVYDFSYWQPIIAFALGFLAKRSPRKSGAYLKSHLVMVGAQVMRPEAEISADEEVSIVATAPYARKIEVGHMRMSVPRGVFQDARKAVQREYGLVVDVSFRMVTIPGGYTLKGSFRRGSRPTSRTKIRRDTAAGATMTYPSLQMRMK